MVYKCVEVATGKNNKKFTAAQQDTLNFYFRVGESALITRAVLECSLTITPVKIIEQGG